MATYYVEITNEFAPDKIADNPEVATEQFTAYLTGNGVTLDADGGVSFALEGYYDDSDVFHDGVFAIIDATADPTTTAQAYDWDYTAGASLDDLLADIQAWVTAGSGAASTTNIYTTMTKLFQYLGLSLNYD
jgi:hypothetical protein